MWARFAYVLLAAALCVLAVADPCALTCAVGKTCLATSNDALACLQSMPFNADWANATLAVLSQTLENYGFGALFHNTGPPYPVQLDLQKELAAAQSMANVGQFATDLDFQEHVQNILQATQDAHTRYSKPACYNAVFLQPFAFDMRVEEKPGSASNEPVVYIIPNLYTPSYGDVYPGVDVGAAIGKQVVALNGIELTTAIFTWANAHETRSNNPSIRFNSAIRSYLYRSAMSYSILPVEDLTVTLVDGTELTFPWIVSYTKGMADVAACAAVADAALTPRGSFFDFSYPELIEHAQPLDHATLHASRPDREVIVPTTSEYPLTCFVQTVTSAEGQTAGVSRVLVMKVSSFSPPGDDFDVAAGGFLGNAQQCLSVDFDLLVVDVMQNGGGYVCLGLRLLELLVEEYALDYTKVQMNYDLPHSPLMDKYIEVANSPDPYPGEGIIDRATQMAFPDGRAYYYPGRNATQGGVASWRTNFFALNCTSAEVIPAGWVPPRYMPPEKLVILTDGTCGSTCACFTKIPQEAGKATFVGAGGIWDESMDVSSFAGGFVSNPDVMYNISKWSGLEFPKFLTNQHWQFDWAIWYSERLPSRPVQFTEQDPDYREAFWGFPHASIDPTVTSEMVSGLYDRVIGSSVSRLAAAVPPSDSDDDGDDDSSTLLIALIVACALLAITSAALAYVCLVPGAGRRKYSSVARDDARDPLQKDLLPASA